MAGRSSQFLDDPNRVGIKHFHIVGRSRNRGLAVASEIKAQAPITPLQSRYLMHKDALVQQKAMCEYNRLRATAPKLVIDGCAIQHDVWHEKAVSEYCRGCQYCS